MQGARSSEREISSIQGGGGNNNNNRDYSSTRIIVQFTFWFLVVQSKKPTTDLASSDHKIDYPYKMHDCRHFSYF
jgi:hypothetical protein